MGRTLHNYRPGLDPRPRAAKHYTNRRLKGLKMNGDLTALDMALVPSFFISYGIIGLIQLNALFGAAYLRFAAISAARTRSASPQGLVRIAGEPGGEGSARGQRGAALDRR